MAGAGIRLHVFMHGELKVQLFRTTLAENMSQIPKYERQNKNRRTYKIFINTINFFVEVKGSRTALELFCICIVVLGAIFRESFFSEVLVLTSLS